MKQKNDHILLIDCQKTNLVSDEDVLHGLLCGRTSVIDGHIGHYHETVESGRVVNDVAVLTSAQNILSNEKKKSNIFLIPDRSKNLLLFWAAPNAYHSGQWPTIMF